VKTWATAETSSVYNSDGDRVADTRQRSHLHGAISEDEEVPLLNIGE
jgi:hypothetical protein